MSRLPELSYSYEVQMQIIHTSASNSKPRRHFPGLLLLSASAVFSPAVQADTQELQTLMQRNNCLACHQIDKRKYGPNFKEVAERYAGDSQAVEMLAQKIKVGGSGVWGADMMPPQPQVSDEHARKMAELIMSLPK